MVFENGILKMGGYGLRAGPFGVDLWLDDMTDEDI